ncbi:MAG: alpha/beta fold hydrolase [Burkholderiales bacterium]
MKKDFITVAGLRTHYWHAGEGPTLLMLHGQLPGSCVATEWGDNVQCFADAGFSVYAPDLSGFGQTDNPKDASGYAFKTRIAHAQSFIDFFKPDRYSIWGSSMGTYMGCSMALEDSRVDKLVIMPSTILPPPMLDPNGPSVVPLKVSVASMVQDPNPTFELARTVLNRVMSNKVLVSDELVRLFLANWAGKGVEAEAGRRVVGRAPPMHDQLLRLKNRALLLWGADESLPERALLLQRAIPGSELHVLQGCAHWPQVDRPDRTFEIVNTFLRS